MADASPRFWDSATQVASGPVDPEALMADLLRPPPEPFIVVSPRAYFQARWRHAITETCAPLLAVPAAPSVADVLVAPRHR